MKLEQYRTTAGASDPRKVGLAIAALVQAIAEEKLEAKRLMRELLMWACEVNDAIGHEYPIAQDNLEDIRSRVEEFLRRG